MAILTPDYIASTVTHVYVEIVKRIALMLAALLVALSMLSLFTFEPFKWRRAVVMLKLEGHIPEIPWVDLALWLRPKSPVNLYGLTLIANPHQAISNPESSEHAFQIGKQIYEKDCAYCHGSTGEGYKGPSLIAALSSGLSDWSFFSTVARGRPGTPMLAHKLPEREIWQIHSYLRELTLAALGAKNTAHSQKVASDTAVSFESIRDSNKHPGDWLTYAGNYSGHRHSQLASITRKNVKSLRIEWVAQLRSTDGKLEASAIENNGRVFVTESPDGLVSLDAKTGKLLWRYRRPISGGVSLCCGAINRGAAILGDSIFIQTLDAHLLSINAATGEKRWDIQVADANDGYSMTGAPLVLRDKIIVGVAGGEFGIRGSISAFRTDSGERLWTFHTIPGPGEPGHETWNDNSWKTGGAPTWATGAYDPATRTIVWGVGNPGPVFQADKRPGDNLYSNSVVALNEDDGTLRWHFQFTPADDHDWDSVQQPVLADIPWEGRIRSVVLWANRNGFFYVLDRATGKFLHASAFVKQTWATGLQASGRPIVRVGAHPSREGSIVWPWVGGGTNWQPPSFDPKRLSIFVSTIDAASVYFQGEAGAGRGEAFLGSTSLPSGNTPAKETMKAIDVATGKVRWEAKLGPNVTSAPGAIGGVLSTSSGLVFAGYRDDFLALDSDTGKVLRRINVGGIINAPPIAYTAGGRQFVAVSAGSALFAFAIP